MRCERAQEHFSDYCDGTLRGGLLVTVQGHLDECGQCHSEVNDLRAVWSMLDEAPRIEPPADFRAVVWRKIDELESSRAITRRSLPFLDWRALFRPALGLAAAAAVLLVLTPVVAPGIWSEAGLGDPFGLFRNHAPEVRILNSPAIVRDGRSGRELVVPLRTDAARPVDVRVEIVSGTVTLAPAQTRLTVPAGQAADLVLNLPPNADSTPVVLRIMHSQGGRLVTREVTVQQP